MKRFEKAASRVLSITMGLLLLTSAAGQGDVGALVPAAATSCQPSWLPTFGAPGPNGNVRAFAAFDDGGGPALYAGGPWVGFGGVIPKWDGSGWTAIGTSVSGNVNALAVFDDGSGPALYVGGDFGTAGGMSASCIAKWNGTTWSALGAGRFGGSFPAVDALAVFDDGSGPALYAGGQFTTIGGVAANNIAKWNGSTWSALGAGIQGGFMPFVGALAAFDDGSGPALYAAGSFLTAGAVAASNIAKWQGSGWSAVGSGLGLPGLQRVASLAAFDDGSGPALYAAGDFTNAGQIAANLVARWQGSSWSALGSGLSPALPPGAGGLTVFDDGGGPALYVTGVFTMAGGVPVNGIAKWRGWGWSAFGSGLTGLGLLTVFDDGGGPTLYASVLGGGMGYVAKWNGASWSALKSGLNAGVSALASFDDGSGAALYAGGSFTAAGLVPMHYLAKWNGASWSALGIEVNGAVSVLTVFDDGSGASLYAGGGFTMAGGVAANHFAQWNGSSWQALGSGFDSPVALVSFDDGSGKALYAGGAFTVGGVTVVGVEKWNGTSWSRLGGGFSGVNAFVSALEVFDDGSGAALYAGGWFLTSPGGDSFIAKWGCTLPAGARSYGSSSPGCNGLLAIGANSSPHLGNAAFAVTCSNAPPSAGGALLLGFPLMASLPFQGAEVWVNPIFAPLITSSAVGVGQVALPIPADPVFAGVWFGLQFFWIGPNAPPPCPPRAVSASNGLVVTIQP